LKTLRDGEKIEIFLP